MDDERRRESAPEKPGDRASHEPAEPDLKVSHASPEDLEDDLPDFQPGEGPGQTPGE